MASKTITCPHCQGLASVEIETGSVDFRCPHCQGIMASPRASLGSTPSPSDTPAPSPKTSEFLCAHCDGRFRLPAKFQGTLVKCPHCQQRVRVTSIGADRPPLEQRTTNGAMPSDLKIETQSDRTGLRSQTTAKSQANLSPSYDDNQSIVIALGDETVRLQNPTKTLDYRGATLRIRELSRSEKNVRRRIRNIVVSIVALGTLIMAAMFLLRK